MKVTDSIFALVCGRIIGFVVGDILKSFGIGIGFWFNIVLWLAFPLFALTCLWIASLIGRKIVFIFQGAKHLLVGAVATVFDLKFFELLIWICSFAVAIHPLIAKGISFLFSTLIKYWGNKYWAFQKHEKEEMPKEILYFFFITLIGLMLDVICFAVFTGCYSMDYCNAPAVQMKIGVIMAALVVALWNFLGYKFFVFKK